MGLFGGLLLWWIVVVGVVWGVCCSLMVCCCGFLGAVLLWGCLGLLLWFVLGGCCLGF